MSPEQMLRRLIVIEKLGERTFRATLELDKWGKIVICSGHSEVMTETHILRFLTETANKVFKG